MLTCIYATISASQVQVFITGGDMSGSSHGASAISQTTIICVKSSFTNNKYQINFTGQNDSGNNYYVKNSSENTILYSISWQENSRQSAVTTNPQTTITDQTGISFAANCSSSNSGVLTINVPKDNIAQATPGIYTDQITVLVSEST